MKRIGQRRIVEDFKYKESFYQRVFIDKYEWYSVVKDMWSGNYIRNRIGILDSIELEIELENIYQKLKREEKLKRLLK